MKSKYSKEIKSYCISNKFIEYTKNKLNELRLCPDFMQQSFLLGALQNDKRTDCSMRLIHSENAKYKRLRSKIDKLVRGGFAVFITLTFTDKILASTSRTTRRRYVARYLKDTSPFYVANIDFSPDKDREHYHAVIDKRCDFSKWSYGFVFAEKVRVHESDRNRVARYVAKLTNHALKVKCEDRLIYSRSVI